MAVAATLRSPAYAGLILGDDPKYELYHSSRYDHRFGTRRMRPRTRDEHDRREFFGAPYNYAEDLDNPFKSSRPTDRSPSPELEDVRGFMGEGLPSENLEDRDGETDFSDPFGQWYWRQREEEGRQDAHLNRQHRAELLAVSRDPGYNPIPVPPPRGPQRPNDQMQGPNMVSMAPCNRNDPSVDRTAQGYLWIGIWRPPPFPGGLPTPDESDNGPPRPEKKRRGRPRKEEKATVVRNAPRGGLLPSKRKLGKRQVEGEEPPVKRKRGRPRKDGGDGLNGVASTQSSTKAGKNGGAGAKRNAFDNALPPREPAALDSGGRLGGGGKFKPGEVPGDTATLPPRLENEGAEDGSAIPSSSREEERVVIGSADVLSPIAGSVNEPGASSDAGVRAAGDRGREERRRSLEKRFEDVMGTRNIFDPVTLPNRATRSGRDFTS